MSFNPQPKPKKKTRIKTVQACKVKKKHKPKKTSVPKHIRELALMEFQKLRKLEESQGGICICISCGRPIKYGTTECQGGHYISRKNRATELERDNIQPQCSRCNVLLRGNPVAYRFNLIKKIGEERVQRLENMALAREGNTEALERLSQEDRELALLKKNSKYYQAFYDRTRQRIKDLEVAYGINN